MSQPDVVPPASTNVVCGPDHRVLYHTSPAALGAWVAGAFAAPLAAGGSAVVIATPARRDAIAGALRAAGIDLDAVRASGALVEVDAVTAADRLTAGGTVSADAFEELAGGLHLGSSPPPVWIYGEIVAVLWERGQPEAALAVEDLWNGLLAAAPAHLLCGYPAAAASTASTGQGFDDVARRHTVVSMSGPGPVGGLHAGGSGPEDGRARRVMTPLRSALAETAHLEEQRDELAVMLERLDARVAEAGRARDRLLATASHELRTPLTAIVGFSETLLARRNDLDGEIRMGLEVILRNGHHLAALVDDLLLAATLRDTPAQPIPAALALLPALENLIAARRSTTVEVVHHGGRDGSDLAARVLVDPRHLRRVLDQLLDNAERHGRPPVRILVHVDGPKARVAVEDTGELLAGDLVPTLFEPFVQAALGDRRPSLGLGLGLAIARDLAVANGGDVTYEAVEGRNRFVLELPWA